MDRVRACTTRSLTTSVGVGATSTQFELRQLAVDFANLGFSRLVQITDLYIEFAPQFPNTVGGTSTYQPLSVQILFIDTRSGAPVAVPTTEAKDLSVTNVTRVRCKIPTWLASFNSASVANIVMVVGIYNLAGSTALAQQVSMKVTTQLMLGHDIPNFA
jgi:hypothetical protein